MVFRIIIVSLEVTVLFLSYPPMNILAYHMIFLLFQRDHTQQLKHWKASLYHITYARESSFGFVPSRIGEPTIQGTLEVADSRAHGW